MAIFERLIQVILMTNAVYFRV